jgi:DNA-binding transcriptional LysR family regulator
MRSSSRGISISEQGMSLVPRLVDLMQRMRSLRSDEAPEEARPELTIAAPSYLQSFFVPRMAETVPDHRLRCMSMPPMLLRAYAQERLFDIAITVGKERFAAPWVETPLGPLRRALFASPSLAKKLGKGPISESALSEIPFISPLYVVNGQAIPVEDGCPMGRGRRMLGQEVEIIGLGLDLASKSEQLVFGPIIAAEHYLRDKRLCQVQVAEWRDMPSETIHLYCNADRVLKRVQRALIDHATEALATLQST